MSALSVSLDQARAVRDAYEADQQRRHIASVADPPQMTYAYWAGKLHGALSGLVDAIGDAEQAATESDFRVEIGRVSPATRDLVAGATSGGIRSRELQVALDDED